MSQVAGAPSSSAQSPAGQPQASKPDWVAARSAMEIPHLTGFATAQSTSLIDITALRPGIVAGLHFLPGDHVQAGQVLAVLNGPDIEAARIQAQSNLTSAIAADKAARLSLAAETQKRADHLATNQGVQAAASAVQSAQGRLAVARHALAALNMTDELVSPRAGIVQTVTAADGDALAQGASIATIQPAGAAWLRAVFYHATAGDLAAGIHGLFQPASGGAAIPVAIRGALGTAQPDGGLPVALTSPATLPPGSSGSVTLDLPRRNVTLVPTAALILDRGRWWVMSHSAQGDQPVHVIPGAGQGFDTIIESGIQPGQDVVVVNAYLLFHRGIAALYQPPN